MVRYIMMMEHNGHDMILRWLIEARYTAYADWLRYGVGPGGYHLEWHWQGHRSDDKPI